MEVFVKEDGGEGDEEQEDGGEVGGHQLCDNLPLELDGHGHHVPVFVFDQGQVGYGKHGQVLVIGRQIPETHWLTQLVGHEHLTIAVVLKYMHTNLQPFPLEVELCSSRDSQQS